RVLWSIIARETAPGDVPDAGGGKTGAQPPSLANDRTGFFFWLISMQAQAMKILHVIELITTQGIPTAFEFIRKMRERVEETRSKASSNYRLLQETTFKKVEIFLKKGVDSGEMHPKTRLLLEMLQEMVDPATGDLPGNVIVFTQFRDTASFLLAAIEGLNCGKQGDSRPFRPVRFVGQATKSSRDTGLKQQDQEKTLDEFRAGKHNILVATRIAEEGLDIPSVRSIIFYEPVPSEIRYIQRRGRTGRHEKGYVTILIARGTLDEVFYKVALCRLDHMERIADGLKDRPLQDIIRVPLGEPVPSDIAINEALDAYEKQLATTQAPPGRELEMDAGEATRELEEASRQVDEFNAWRYVDLSGVQDPAIQACLQIATRNPASASEWHDMLRRLTGKEKVEENPMKRTRSIKRERKVPSTDSGVKIFNKVTNWVYDQVRALGTANAATDRIEMAFAELKEMASMEEILPEDFEYGVKSGIKNKYWELAKGADGTFKISMKADF
ncbi:MAG: helicase-related protein, partial [Candidatus Sigynarchaeota archaeon]